MINVLTGIGYGIIALAVLIGIGIVMLSSMSGTVAGCSTGYTYQGNATQGGLSSGYCCANNVSSCKLGGGVQNSANATLPSTATQTLNTFSDTYIGSNLVSWIPVIIVLTVGLMFLGAFMARKGRQS
jgi:hypothetical protein